MHQDLKLEKIIKQKQPQGCFWVLTEYIVPDPEPNT